MIKWVLRDYFSAFRWGNLKTNYSIWFLLSLIILLPLSTQVYSNGTNTLIYYMVILPFIHCLVSNHLHDGAFPKIMFLSPMDEMARRQYITYTCYLRILLPILVQIICICVLIFFKLAKPIYAIDSLINIISLSLVVGGPGNYRNSGIGNQSGTPQPRGITIRRGIEIAIFIISMISIFLHASILDGSVAIWKLIFFVYLPMILLIVLTIKHLTYWKSDLTLALNYETSYISNTTPEKSR